MTKKVKIIIVVIIVFLVGLFILRACNKSSIVGTYIGEEGGTLKILSDGSWSYHYDGWRKDIDYEGTYFKLKEHTYQLDSDKIIFYADIEENGLYVYSDDSDWRAETMRKTD